jgi:hypothetical protein
MSDSDITIRQQSANKLKNEPAEIPRFEQTGSGTNNYSIRNVDNLDLGSESSAGQNKIYIDYPNGRIIINDGTNDRVILGFLNNGF